MLRNQGLLYSFSDSANERVWRSWEGAQPGSSAKMASGNIPYHRRCAEHINGGWLGEGILFFFREFELLHGFSLFFRSSTKSASPTIAAQGLATQLVPRPQKNYIVISLFFIFNMIMILISISSSSYFVVLLNCLLSILLPILLEGKRRGE